MAALWVSYLQTLAGYLARRVGCSGV